MKDFKKYLQETGEVGEVTQVFPSLVFAKGLPGAFLGEIVLFENGDLGQIISTLEEELQILLLSGTRVRPGEKIARSGDILRVGVGEEMLGRVIDPIGSPVDGKGAYRAKDKRAVDTDPSGLEGRDYVSEPLETGVSVVDLAVPLAKGQRELVVGDRKTGKSALLLQTIATQVGNGVICIYAAIAKKKMDAAAIQEFLEKSGSRKNTVLVISDSRDPSGLIFLTPYTAMTIAEYFRDQGKDVLIIMDDMTTHAKYYREISLLAKRFPGRSSYPGDIFYIHARLMERAGKFKKGSITALPVSETIMGDLSGFIQTNLMAMTDGHIYFDTDLYNKGRRPAINPFLSVTRVGRQAQTSLMRELNSELTSFLVKHERLKQYLHFGAELTESTKRTLDLGDKIVSFFDQGASETIPPAISAYLLAAIWGGFWREQKISEIIPQIKKVIATYKKNKEFAKKIDEVISSSKDFTDFVRKVRESDGLILGVVSAPGEEANAK